jgi:hypothetical protein
METEQAKRPFFQGKPTIKVSPDWLRDGQKPPRDCEKTIERTEAADCTKRNLTPAELRADGPIG